MSALQRLQELLKENSVPFEVHHHPLAYTAQAVAEVEHVPGREVIKVVMAMADGKLIMLALPAPHHLDTAKAAAATGAKDVRLAHEDEFESAFPDCEVGAMPPFGGLYGLDLFIDQALANDEFIVFPAGTHTETIRMKYADFARIARPKVADLAFRG
jgi:Ala-tRNA(Pro) deacylase